MLSSTHCTLHIACGPHLDPVSDRFSILIILPRTCDFDLPHQSKTIKDTKTNKEVCVGSACVGIAQPHMNSQNEVDAFVCCLVFVLGQICDRVEPPIHCWSVWEVFGIALGLLREVFCITLGHAWVRFGACWTLHWNFSKNIFPRLSLLE